MHLHSNLCLDTAGTAAVCAISSALLTASLSPPPPAQVELTFDHRQGLGLSFKEGRGAPPVVELIRPGQAMANQNDKLVVQVQPGWVVTSVRGGDEGEEADTRSKTAGEMITKLKSFELPWTVCFAQ